MLALNEDCRLSGGFGVTAPAVDERYIANSLVDHRVGGVVGLPSVAFAKVGAHGSWLEWLQ